MTGNTGFQLKIHLRDECTGVVRTRIVRATAFVCKSERTVMLNMSDCMGNNGLSVAYFKPAEARKIARELTTVADEMDEKLRSVRKGRGYDG